MPSSKEDVLTYTAFSIPKDRTNLQEREEKIEKPNPDRLTHELT
jgi:hypothetical protein